MRPVDDDPIDPEEPPGASYYTVMRQAVTTTPGKAYVVAMTLGLAASTATAYLTIGTTRVSCALTSTMTRFEVSAVALEATTNVFLEVLLGQADLVILFNEAGVWEASTAPTYHAGTLAKQVDVSETGDVTFVAAPTNGHALTFSGDYISPTTVKDIPTVWGTDDLFNVNYTQSADVMVLANRSYPPQWLGRYTDYNWSLIPFANTSGPFEDQNINTAKTVSLNIVGTVGTDVVITANADIFTADSVGKLFKIESKDGQKPWVASETSLTAGMYRSAGGKNYTLDATGGGTAGTVRPTHESDSASDGLLSWTYHDQGFGVAVIRALDAATPTRKVTARVVVPFGSIAASYKWAFGAWGTDVGYPGAVTWHQQRMVFAGSTNYPNTFWTSRSGAYKDFGTSNPIRDDDGLTFTLSASQMNGINGLMSFQALLALTEGGIWAIGDKTPLTPSNLSADMQGFRGAYAVPPLGVGNAICYVQDKTNVVRDLTYEWGSNSYNGNDLNSFAPHLVRGHKIVDWCFQPSTSTIWAIRDDGVLLGCTYQKDQEIIGWHRTTTDGTFESCCCVSEGDEDPVYVSVLRGTKRYIERFASRIVTDVRDGWFVDSGLSWDGANTTTTTITFTPTEGEGGGDTTYTADASADLFVAGDVGDQLVLFDETTGYTYRWLITALVSATSTTVVPVRDPLPAQLSVAITDWSFARKTFAGLDHLEGETVRILADGAYYGDETIASGAFTLTTHAYKVIAGLGYDCDIETLGLNVFGEQYFNKPRVVSGVTLMVDETWALEIGNDATNLFPVETEVAVYDEPVVFEQGIIEKKIQSGWGVDGRMLIRCSSPLPVSIQSITPEVIIG